MFDRVLNTHTSDTLIQISDFSAPSKWEKFFYNFSEISIGVFRTLSDI